MKFGTRGKALAAAAMMCAAWTAAPQDASAAQTVRMVVTAAFVSNSGLDVYEEMATYLSAKTGMKMEVVSGLSYAEADAALDKGEIQIGAICGLPYTAKAAEGKYGLVAIPVMATPSGTWPDVKAGYENIPGKYYSYTIVQKDSPIKSWEELRGKSYAFNDMGSNSGYNMPRSKLVQLGAKSWEDYFSKIVVSGSHEESIRLVAQGAVVASSVDSLVLDYDRSIGEEYSKQVRVIEQLNPGGAGAPPIVFSKAADKSVVKPLQDALLAMHLDADGQKILKKALLTRFAPPDDANYDDIRKMEKAAKDAGFVDYKK